MTSRIKFMLQIICLALILGIGWTVQAQDAENERPRLRVVNASLGLPSADVYVGGTLYFQDVTYGYISNYVPVDPTNLRLELRPAGVKDVEPIRGRDFPFEANKDYTLVIVGTDENIEDSPWIIEDNNKEALIPGQARVRVVHTSSTVPAVEVCLDNRCQTLTYRRFSEYVTLDSGLYTAKVRFIGTDELFLYKLPTGFDAGQVYSIYIFDPKQGEVKPRIILHPDIGQTLPHYPEGPHAPYPPQKPGDPGVGPPLYPPVTGAFLSPTAWGVVISLGLIIIGGMLWLLRRQFRNA